MMNAEGKFETVTKNKQHTFLCAKHEQKFLMSNTSYENYERTAEILCKLDKQRVRQCHIVIGLYLIAVS
jgi:hypothetical protein